MAFFFRSLSLCQYYRKKETNKPTREPLAIDNRTRPSEAEIAQLGDAMQRRVEHILRLDIAMNHAMLIIVSKGRIKQRRSIAPGA